MNFCGTLIVMAALLKSLVGSDSSGLVQLEIYYEVCWPFCQAILSGTLAQAWSVEGFTDVANVTLIPWGHETYNVTHNSDGTNTYNFSCQHGINECVGNKIHTCVRYLSNYNASIYIPFMIGHISKMNQHGCYAISRQVLINAIWRRWEAWAENF